MNELLKFISTGANGAIILLPPKFDFVFYDTKLELYKKSKLVRMLDYNDIIEISKK